MSLVRITPKEVVMRIRPLAAWPFFIVRAGAQTMWRIGNFSPLKMLQSMVRSERRRNWGLIGRAKVVMRMAAHNLYGRSHPRRMPVEQLLVPC